MHAGTLIEKCVSLKYKAKFSIMQYVTNGSGNKNWTIIREVIFCLNMDVSA